MVTKRIKVFASEKEKLQGIKGLDKEEAGNYGVGQYKKETGKRNDKKL